jgi:hypothetical protein
MLAPYPSTGPPVQLLPGERRYAEKPTSGLNGPEYGSPFPPTAIPEPIPLIGASEPPPEGCVSAKFVEVVECKQELRSKRLAIGRMLLIARSRCR